jgi:hypothetical protein
VIITANIVTNYRTESPIKKCYLLENSKLCVDSDLGNISENAQMIRDKINLKGSTTKLSSGTQDWLFLMEDIEIEIDPSWDRHRCDILLVEIVCGNKSSKFRRQCEFVSLGKEIAVEMCYNDMTHKLIIRPNMTTEDLCEYIRILFDIPSSFEIVSFSAGIYIPLYSPQKIISGMSSFPQKKWTIIVRNNKSIFGIALDALSEVINCAYFTS